MRSFLLCSKMRALCFYLSPLSTRLFFQIWFPSTACNEGKKLWSSKPLVVELCVYGRVLIWAYFVTIGAINAIPADINTTNVRSSNSNPPTLLTYVQEKSSSHTLDALPVFPETQRCSCYKQIRQGANGAAW
jgi:hypothetical protein